MSSLKLLPLFIGMIALGAALALYSNSPLLVILFIGALTLISFAALDYALYILVGFLAFSFRFKILPGTEMQIPTEPLLAAMSAALLLRWIIMSRSGGHINFPFRLPFMLYAISLGLSILNASNRFFAAKGSLRAITYTILAIVVFNIVSDKKRLKRLFVTAIVPASIAVIWTVIFLADRLAIWRYTRAYEGLLFTSYVPYGAFVAVILLILLARFIFDRGIYDRVVWMVFLSIFAVGICFSFSRGVWVSFIGAMGFMLLQKSTGTQHKRILIIGGAVLFLGFLLMMPSISGQIISRAKSVVDFRFASNRTRLLRWGFAFKMFLKNPILGCGYGSFAQSYVNNPELIGEYLSQYSMSTHNKYLQILAETGLMGFMAWVWMFVAFFRYGFRLLARCSIEEAKGNHSSSKMSFYRSVIIGIMAAETYLLIHFLANTLIKADVIGVPFWLLIGLLPAIGNIMEKEIQSPAEA